MISIKSQVVFLTLQWDRFIQPVLFTYKTKEFRISKQSLYILVYRWESTLVIDYEKYGSSIMKRLLEIMEKILQLKEVVRKIIWKL